MNPIWNWCGGMGSERKKKGNEEKLAEGFN